MKNFFLVLVIFSFIFSSFAKEKYVDIQHWKSKNGTPVYFVENHSLPIVDIATVFHAGSAYDGNQWGIATLTNQMIGEETKTLSSDQIADQLGNLGVNFDASNNRDMAVVHMRTMSNPKYFPDAVKLYSELLADASFSENTFARNKSQLISTIQSSLQNSATLAGIEFYKRLYGDQPYGHPVNGTVNSINQITAANTNSFYKKYYTQKNAMVVIVGDVNKSMAKSIVNHVLNKLPEGTLEQLPKQTAIENNNGEFIVPYQGSQSTVILGQVGINRLNNSYFPLTVGNTILGNMGLTSLLMKTIRDEHGLVYGVSSSFNTWQDRGPFYIALQTKNQSVSKAIALAKQTLENYVKNGPSDDQLSASKKYLDGSFPFTFATNSSTLSNVINIAFYKLPLNYLDTYRSNIDKVTKQSIQNAFKQIINPQRIVVVVAGHAKK